MKLGVIADDFTGATDIAGFLVENGLSTLQLAGVPEHDGDLPQVDAVVISLKSRSCPADEAVRDSLAALDWLKADLEAFLQSSQACVNGEVVLETQGGRVDAVAVRSPHLLHAKGATYAQSADWGVAEAEGFIRLYGMSSTLWAEINAKG